MSVYDKEPYVPVTDSGRGLIVLGWMWVLGTGIFWFMHPRSNYIPMNFEWLCAILGLVGIAMILWGHLRRKLDREVLTSSEVEVLHEAHKEDEHAGNQVGTGEAA